MQPRLLRLRNCTHNNHPFRTLWQDHLATITTAGKWDSLIDAYVSVYIKDRSWRRRSTPDSIVQHRQLLRMILHNQPPNIAIVDHTRTPWLHSFICITKYYVDRWVTAEPNQYLKLALEAILKSTLNHEIAHWIFTNVCTGQLMGDTALDLEAQRVGLFSQEYSDAIDLRLPLSLRTVRLRQLSPKTNRENTNKHTPKPLHVAWDGDVGEAGNFIEVQSQGGVICFDHSVDTAIIQTDASTSYLLRTPELLAFHQEGSFRFVPPPQVLASSPLPGSPQRSKASSHHGVFFPQSEDRACLELSSPSTCPLVGVGILCGPRPACIERINSLKLAQEILREKMGQA